MIAPSRVLQPPASIFLQLVLQYQCTKLSFVCHSEGIAENKSTRTRYAISSLSPSKPPVCTITPSPLGTLGFDGQNDPDIAPEHDVAIAGVVVSASIVVVVFGAVMVVVAVAVVVVVGAVVVVGMVCVVAVLQNFYTTLSLNE